MTTTSTSTKNPTKKEMFAEIIALAEGRPTTVSLPAIVEFASHEIELLEKKAATPRKPTATQVENEAFAAEILSYLTAVDMPKSIKELQSEVASLAPLSNQRISHILSALVEKEKLEKSYIKKTPFFCVK